MHFPRQNTSFTHRLLKIVVQSNNIVIMSPFKTTYTLFYTDYLPCTVGPNILNKDKLYMHNSHLLFTLHKIMGNTKNSTCYPLILSKDFPILHNQLSRYICEGIENDGQMLL